jgi:hypothetical protein
MARSPKGLWYHTPAYCQSRIENHQGIAYCGIVELGQPTWMISVVSSGDDDPLDAIEFHAVNDSLQARLNSSLANSTQYCATTSSEDELIPFRMSG